jgi:glycosyltransferase involved in cell wall biosynthesis
MLWRCMNDKKRFLYLRTDLGTQDLIAGGSVAHTLGVIEGFVAQGHTVVVASSAMVGLLKKIVPTVAPLTLPVWSSWVGFKVQCLISNIFFFVSAFSLCDALTTSYIYQRYSLLNCVGVMLSWWKSVPLILEFNGSEVWVDEHWSKNKRFRLRFLVRWFEKINIRYASTIVVVSQPLKTLLIEQGIDPEKILVNPNGVASDLYDCESLADERLRIRSELGLTDSFVFGFAGTFSYWHGINILHAMIPGVITRCARAKFLLIGAGPLAHDLERALAQVGIASERVIFVGMVPQSQARSYLAACDAFVSPAQPNSDGSEFFGSPTKLFEYMSLAKPIIASDLPVIADIIYPAVRLDALKKEWLYGDNSMGILVAAHDSAGFIDAASDLIDGYDQGARERMGKSARRKVLSNYTWHHHTAQILTFVSRQ